MHHSRVMQGSLFRFAPWGLRRSPLHSHRTVREPLDYSLRSWEKFIRLFLFNHKDINIVDVPIPIAGYWLWFCFKIINHPLRLYQIPKLNKLTTFAPFPLQKLHHYYELVRHRNLTASKLCAPFTQQSRLPVSIIKAWIRVLLSLSRMPHYQ